MARTVKPEEFAAKRGEILDATQRLVVTKGYEQISIQDILHEVRISSGAFHHYFDSRKALLDAFIERIQQESEKPLLPIIHDPQRSALEKLQGFFGALHHLRIAHRDDVVKLLRVWYTDDNAVVRQKVDEAVFKQRVPLLTEIIQQGVREGCIKTTNPDKVGEVIMSLLQGLGNAQARLLLSLDGECDELHIIEEIVVTYATYMDAMERVLGLPPDAFPRANAEAVSVWVRALRA